MADETPDAFEVESAYEFNDEPDIAMRLWNAIERAKEEYGDTFDQFQIAFSLKEAEIIITELMELRKKVGNESGH